MSKLTKIQLDRINSLNKKNEIKFDDLVLLMDALPTPLIYKSRSGQITLCNQAFADFNKLEKSDIIGKTLYDIQSKVISDEYNFLDEKIMAEKITDYQKHEIFYIGEEERHIMISRAAHLDESGEAIGIIAVFQDITEEKINEKREYAIAKIREIFWKINQTLMNFEDDKVFFNRILVEINSVFKGMNHATVMTLSDENKLSILSTYGYDIEDSHSFSIDLEDSYIWPEMKNDLTSPCVINDIELLLNDTHQPFVRTESEKVVRSTLVIPITFDKKIKWMIFLDSNENHVYDDIDVFAARFFQEEVPIFYRIYELTTETLKLSRYDKLTGLMNRAYFDSIFYERLTMCQHSSEPLILISFDLDGLKRVNDTFGHQSGDEYITSFSDFIKSKFRLSDIFARLGGDEFAGIMFNTDIFALKVKLKELRIEFSKLSINPKMHKFRGSFSFGISQYPDDASQISDLMITADERMYKDKRRKENMLSRHLI